MNDKVAESSSGDSSWQHGDSEAADSTDGVSCASVTSQMTSDNNQPRDCWQCGGIGHVQRSCPRRAQKALRRRRYGKRFQQPSPGSSPSLIMESPNNPSTTFSLLKAKIKQEQQVDPEVAKILEALQTSSGKSLVEGFSVNKDWLYYTSGTTVRLYVPARLRNEVLCLCHDHMDHPNTAETVYNIWAHYHWPNINEFAENYIQSCPTCQLKNTPGHEVDNASFPFKTASMDVFGPLPQTPSGNRYIVVFVDHYSEWPEAFPLPNTAGNTLAFALANNILPRYGYIDTLITDYVPDTLREVFAKTLKTLKIRLEKYPLTYKRCNPRSIRVLTYIWTFIFDKVQNAGTDWDLYLTQALASVRFFTNDDMTSVPYNSLYKVDFGQIQRRLPNDSRVLRAGRRMNVIEQMEDAFKLLQATPRLAANVRKESASNDTQTHSFKMGDSFWNEETAAQGQFQSSRPPCAARDTSSFDGLFSYEKPKDSPLVTRPDHLWSGVLFGYDGLILGRHGNSSSTTATPVSSPEDCYSRGLDTKACPERENGRQGEDREVGSAQDPLSDYHTSFASWMQSLLLTPTPQTLCPLSPARLPASQPEQSSVRDIRPKVVPVGPTKLLTVTSPPTPCPLPPARLPVSDPASSWRRVPRRLYPSREDASAASSLYDTSWSTQDEEDGV